MLSSIAQSTRSVSALSERGFKKEATKRSIGDAGIIMPMCTPATPLLAQVSPSSPSGAHHAADTTNGLTPSSPIHDRYNGTVGGNAYDDSVAQRSGSGSSTGQSLDVPSSSKTKDTSTEEGSDSVTIVLGSVDELSYAATPHTTPVLSKAAHRLERSKSEGSVDVNGSGAAHLPKCDSALEEETVVGGYLERRVVDAACCSHIASSCANITPQTTHIEIYAPETRTMYHQIPLAWASHRGDAKSPKFYLCQKHIAGISKCDDDAFGGSSACAMGNHCRFVHIDVPLSQLKGDVIHVHYVYRSEECCSYERLNGNHENVSARHLSVLGPHYQEPAEDVPLSRLLKTKGSVAALASLMGTKVEKASSAGHLGLFCHCQDYYFQQICNRGASCEYIHVISVDITQERDSIRPGTYTKRVQLTGAQPRQKLPVAKDVDVSRGVEHQKKASPQIQETPSRAPNKRNTSAVKSSGCPRALPAEDTRTVPRKAKTKPSLAPSVGRNTRNSGAKPFLNTLHSRSGCCALIGQPISVQGDARMQVMGLPPSVASTPTPTVALEDSRDLDDGAEAVSTVSNLTARSIVGWGLCSVLPRVGAPVSPRTAMALRRMPQPLPPSPSLGKKRSAEGHKHNNVLLVGEMGEGGIDAVSSPGCLGTRQNSFSLVASAPPEDGYCGSPFSLAQSENMADAMNALVSPGELPRRRRRGGVGRRLVSCNSPYGTPHVTVRVGVGATPQLGMMMTSTKTDQRAHVRQNTTSTHIDHSVDTSFIDPSRNAASSSPCSGLSTPAIARAPPGRYVHNPYGQRSGQCTPAISTRANTEILSSPLVSQHQIAANETSLPLGDCANLQEESPTGKERR